VVGNECVASFAIEANEIVLALGVAASLDHKTEVDRKALVTDSGAHSSGRARGLFTELGGKTDWAFFKNVRKGESRHTLHETVHGREATKIEVAKALMP
jgi:hypothetical protein